MATVTINIPDALVPRIRAAARAKFSSPEDAALTDAALFKKITADYWRSVLSEYEEQEARKAADATLDTVVLDARNKVKTDAATVG